MNNHRLYPALLLQLLFHSACLDIFDKQDAESDEEEAPAPSDNEGATQGDCLDGDDNDGDGFTDCDDQGCWDKPACQDDTTDLDTEEEDTEDTDEPEDTGPEICKNDYHPIHTEGWSKSFNVIYEDGEGTATEEALPPNSYQEQDVYTYRDTLSVMAPVEILPGVDLGTAEKGWDNTMYVTCDPNQGMILRGWDGISINGGMDMNTFSSYDMEVQVDFGTGHTYLPYEFAIGGISSWSNSYTLTKTENDPTNGPQTNTSTITSTHSEIGFISNYQLFDGSTVEAYKTVYEMESSNGFETTNTYVEQYWVKGLGMVQEDYIDDAGSIVFSKELSGYSGLSVIE